MRIARQQFRHAFVDGQDENLSPKNTMTFEIYLNIRKIINSAKKKLKKNMMIILLSAYSYD